MPAYATPNNSLLRNPMLGRAAVALAVYEGLTQASQRLRNGYQSRFAYTVTVAQGDPIYNDVHRWLLSLIPEAKHRAVVVTSRTGGAVSDGPTDPATDESESPPLSVLLNESRPRRVVVDGHGVTVVLVKPEVSVATALTIRESPDQIVFTCRTRDAQRAVVDHLARIHAARGAVRTPVLNMVSQWGGWRTRNDLPTRSLASVSLPEEQKRRIVGDLRDFLDDEGRYNRLAIPWHRGYMFHGPPGTGKTSLVRALASEFNLDLWYVSLADLKAESSLMTLLSEVGPRSILLLEDIDTIKITHDRDVAQGTISMGSLLNALDGVATPHGLVTMMTTNRFDTLDSALTRAGRMDVIEMIDFPTPTSVRHLFEHFYGVEADVLPDWPDEPIVGLSTAAVAETFKRHLRDPQAAAALLHRQALGVAARVSHNPV